MAAADDAPLMFDDLPSFDDMPDAPEPQASDSGPAPGQNSPLMFDDLPSFDDMPAQPESQLKTFGREAAHSALPAAGGMLAAGAAGAIAGTMGAGPVGTVVGGIAGMILGSMGTEKAQDWALEQIGFDDSQQRAANIKENPKTAFGGGLAPALATMSPVKGVQLAQRGIGAGMMGGFEAGSELYNEGKLDPFKMGASLAAGAAFPQANRVGEALLNTGAAGARRVLPGRPGVQASPDMAAAQDEAGASQQTTVTSGTALEQPAPSAAGETSGNPQSAPERSSRTYPKDAAPDGEATDAVTKGLFSPDVEQALRKSLDEGAVGERELPDLPKSPDADLQRGRNPGERLPIETGIEEARPAAAEPRPAEPAPVPEQAPAEPAVVGGFRTEKGSVYKLHEDGSTTRDKAARPEHPGDEGPKPRSEKTYFLTEEQANALAPPQGRFRIIDHGDGTLSVATPGKGSRWGVAPSQRRVGPIATAPQEGLHPLELWSGTVSKQGDRGYNAAHFGNKVVGEGSVRSPSEPLLAGRDYMTPKRPTLATAPAAEAHPISARVAESAKAAHPEPTPAQIDAGNQKMGHDRMFGHEVSIENAKGSIRKSKPGFEPAWEVKMPYDYGYFRGTKGADGDHVDFANLGTGERHFVIDQRDANTGKFDEHKVFTYAKDANDAIDHYTRGFSDNKGLDRLGSVKEVNEADLKAWLAKPGKKNAPFDPNFKDTAGPSEGEKPLPTVVTAAVTKMREAGVPEDAVKKFMDMEPSERLAKASRAVNDRKKPGEYARPDRVRTPPPVVEGLVNDQGQPVTARTKADAAAKSADVKTMNDAYAKLGEVTFPNTAEEKADLRQRLQDFHDATKGVTYRPAFKHEPYLVARAAKRLLTAKNPSDERWTKFISDALVGDEARATSRIESDIGLGRRGGEEAVARAEERSASPHEVEDKLIDAIDAKKAFDVPHEEAEAFVKPEPVTSREDLKRLDTKTAKLDISKPEDRAKLEDDTAKLANNLIKTADRKPPVGASEGAASPVRKIKLDDPDMIKRILESANKKKGEAPGAVREEELGRVVDKTEPRDKLADFWNDERGSLDFDGIEKAFRASSKPVKNFLTKAFGKTWNDAQRHADATLAHVISEKNSRESEIARKLFDAKFYQWLDQTKPAERIAYLKALEDVHSTTTAAEAKNILIRNGISAEKAAWMADEAPWHRELLDQQFREDAARNSAATYRPGYVPHIFKDSKVGGLSAEQWMTKHVGPTWYQKERAFNSIIEAMKAGFELEHTHPHQLINARLLASVRANTIVDAARALNRDGLAFPLSDAPKENVRSWTFERQLPDGQKWVFAPDAEHFWTNAIEPAGLAENKGAIGSIYKGWLRAKGVFVPVQLALSAFHELHIIGNIAIVQNLHNAFEGTRAGGLASAPGNYWRAVKNMGNDTVFALPLDKLPLGAGKFLDSKGSFSQYAGRQIQDIWKAPHEELTDSQRMIKQLFKEAGASPYQPREDVIGAKVKFAEAVADLRNREDFWPNTGAAARVVKEGFLRGMEKMQEPMFKYQIPALKNMALLRAMSTAIKMQPELMDNAVLRKQALREIAKDVDDRFGEMFYTNLFWNKTLKDVGVGSMLSLSWNLGQYRQVQGALGQVRRMGEDLLGKQRTPTEEARLRASNKISFVSHYVGFSMLSAGALSYALSGEFPTGMDYFYPRNGLKNDDGSPMRVGVPFNTREGPMLKAHADEHGGGPFGWIGGARQLLWNKMILQPIAEAMTNKDFFGRKLYDTNAPWYKQALQLVDSTLGRMFNPISIAGADRAREQGGGKRDVALAYAGFGPAPKYVNEDALQRRINHLFTEEGTAYSKPYEYGAKTGLGRGLVQGLIRGKDDPLESEARGKGRHELAQAHLKGDAAGEAAARKKLVEQGGMSTRTAGKMRSETEFQYKFARLPQATQRSLAREMSQQQFEYYVNTNKSGLSNANRTTLVQDWAKRPKQSSLNP